ncbi:MAG: hypothetical protein K0R65_2247 [Crocinitomicaceae bacterium]|jgi:hypothetical protein|nr:hypothetical protein [Crocinitomicaceae bacterium]
MSFIACHFLASLNIYKGKDTDCNFGIFSPRRTAQVAGNQEAGLGKRLKSKEKN